MPTAKTVKPGTVILHSQADDVPFWDSVELVQSSGLYPDSLVVVGHEHRLADPRSHFLDPADPPMLNAGTKLKPNALGEFCGAVVEFLVGTGTVGVLMDSEPDCPGYHARPRVRPRLRSREQVRYEAFMTVAEPGPSACISYETVDLCLI